VPYEPDRPDNLHRLNMGVFPEGAGIIPNPYNKIPASAVGDVHFVPGFPVMAWPMIEWVLDGRYAHLHGGTQTERSVIVFGAMEATLTPLMERHRGAHPASRCSACPASTTRVHGRHIELGVKGRARRP
jgi:molybdopterin-biosynthesis enzyme MoeA-like protein